MSGEDAPFGAYHVCDGVVEISQNPRKVFAANAQLAAETDVLQFSTDVPTTFFSELEHYGRCLVVSRSVFSSCGHFLGSFTVLVREKDRAALTFTSSMAEVMVRGKAPDSRWARLVQWWGGVQRRWGDLWRSWWTREVAQTRAEYEAEAHSVREQASARRSWDDEEERRKLILQSLTRISGMSGKDQSRFASELVLLPLPHLRAVYRALQLPDSEVLSALLELRAAITVEKALRNRRRRRR